MYTKLMSPFSTFDVLVVFYNSIDARKIDKTTQQFLSMLKPFQLYYNLRIGFQDFGCHIDNHV